MAGLARKRIAAQLGLDPKTVRRYVGRAARVGLGPADGEAVHRRGVVAATQDDAVVTKAGAARLWTVGATACDV